MRRADAGGGRQRAGVDQRPGAVDQQLGALAAQRHAVGQPQRGHHRVAGQAQRGAEQLPIAAIDAAALQPDAGQFQLLQVAAGVKRLSRGGQAQRQHVPADHLRARRQCEALAVLYRTAAVGDVFKRQPFQPSAVGQIGPHLLHRQRPGAAVETRGAWRGDHRMAAGRQRGVEFQHVATDHAAGRVHQHVVAHRLALGVEPL